MAVDVLTPTDGTKRPFALAHVPDPVPPGPLASTQADRLRVNALYFDALLSLIPSKFFTQLVKTDVDEPDERFYKVDVAAVTWKHADSCSNVYRSSRHTHPLPHCAAQARWR